MKSSRLIIRIIAALFCLLVSKPGLAQGWVDLKFGMADSKPIIAVQFNAVDNSNLYSVTSRFGSTLLDSLYYREVSVAYGRRYLNRLGAATIQAGIGLVELDDRGVDSKFEPTIPLVANFTLGKYLGVSGSAFLSINRIQPFIGIELGIAIGKFK